MELSLRHEWSPHNSKDWWKTSRLELDVNAESSGDSQKLSGQIHVSSAREMLCLSMPSESRVEQNKINSHRREHELKNLHSHLNHLYKLKNNSIPVLPCETEGSHYRSCPSLPFHPSLPVLFGVSSQDEKSNDPIRMAFQFHSHSLRSVLCMERHRLGGMEIPGFVHADKRATTDLSRRFLLFQLVRALQQFHERGASLGGRFTSLDLRVTDMHWLQLPPALDVSLLSPPQAPAAFIDKPIDWSVPITERWAQGKISNFEYLMNLNHAVGRSTSDSRLHAVMPWVSDLSSPQGGWRDLSKTKQRLSKGDDVLDMTYRNSSPPHHIEELMSELAYYMYEARRAPLSSLRSVVRQNFVPAQYPVSIQRLIAWSVDEATPAFYTDSAIFKSKHTKLGLGDLVLPDWFITLITNPDESKQKNDKNDIALQWLQQYQQEHSIENWTLFFNNQENELRYDLFISYHRYLLESREVSQKLHIWIDLIFGASLLGQSAISNKNVCYDPRKDHNLNYVSNLGLDYRPRLIALFSTPHPSRRCAFLMSTTNEQTQDSMLLFSNTDPIATPLVSSQYISNDLNEIVHRQEKLVFKNWLGNSYKNGSRSEIGLRGQQTKNKTNNVATSQKKGNQLEVNTAVHKESLATPTTTSLVTTSAAPVTTSNLASSPTLKVLESAFGTTAFDLGPGLNSFLGNNTPPAPNPDQPVIPPPSLTTTSPNVTRKELQTSPPITARKGDISKMARDPNRASLSSSSSSRSDRIERDGWSVTPVDTWVLDLVLNNEVMGVDDKELTRLAKERINAAAKASFASASSIQTSKSTKKSHAYHGSSQEDGPDSRADEVLLRCAPQILLPQSQGNKTLSDCLSPNMKSRDILWRCSALELEEMEHRVSFGLKSDAVLDSSRLLHERSINRLQRLYESNHDKKEEDSGWMHPDHFEHLKKDDAFAVGLVLAELAMGSPILSPAKVTKLKQQELKKDSVYEKENEDKMNPIRLLDDELRCDLRTLLPLETMSQLPSAIKNALNGLLHPNPEQRMSIQDLVELSEVNAKCANSPIGKTDSSQGKCPDHHWCPPCLFSFHNGRTTEEQSLTKNSEVTPECCNNKCLKSTSSSTQKKGPRKPKISDSDPCLLTLFPSYFPLLYSFIKAMVRYTQIAETTRLGQSYGFDESTCQEATCLKSPPVSVVKDETIAKAHLSAFVDALEFFPDLLLMEPLGFTFALPYLLKAVLGSSTPYVFAFEYIRRQKHRINSSEDTSSSYNLLKEDNDVEDLLLRVSQCCTFVKLDKETSSEYSHYSNLILHIPIFVEKLGAKIGGDASQSLLVPLVTSLLSSSAWHPSIAIPLLSTIASSHSPSSCHSASLSSLHIRSESDNISNCGGNVWQSIIEVGGWSAFVHTVLPLAISWIDPLYVAEQTLKKALMHHDTSCSVDGQQPKEDGKEDSHGELYDDDEVAKFLKVQSKDEEDETMEDYLSLSFTPTSSLTDFTKLSYQIPRYGALSLAKLTHPRSLGPALVLRYVLPPILRNLCKYALKDMYLQPLTSTTSPSPNSLENIPPIILNAKKLIQSAYRQRKILHLSEQFDTQQHSDTSNDQYIKMKQKYIHKHMLKKDNNISGNNSTTHAEAIVWICHSISVHDIKLAIEAIRLSLDRICGKKGVIYQLQVRFEQLSQMEEKLIQFIRTNENRQKYGNYENSNLMYNHDENNDKIRHENNKLYDKKREEIAYYREVLFYGVKEVIIVLRGLLTPQITSNIVQEYFLGCQLLKRNKTYKIGNDYKNQEFKSVCDLLMLLLPTSETLSKRIEDEIEFINLISLKRKQEEEKNQTSFRHLSVVGGNEPRVGSLSGECDQQPLNQFARFPDSGLVQQQERYANARKRRTSSLFGSADMSLVQARASERLDVEIMKDCTALVIEVCMHLGNSNLTEILVLPQLETFFGAFHRVYGPILGGQEDSKSLSGEGSVALDVLRTIYYPLASMVGFAALDKLVPSLKPFQRFLKDSSQSGSEDSSNQSNDSNLIQQHSNNGISPDKKKSAVKWDDMFDGGAEGLGGLDHLVGKGIKWFKKQKDKHMGKDENHRRGSLPGGGGGLGANIISGLSDVVDALELDDDAVEEENENSWFYRETVVSRLSVLSDDFGDSVTGTSPRPMKQKDSQGQDGHVFSPQIQKRKSSKHKKHKDQKKIELNDSTSDYFAIDGRTKSANSDSSSSSSEEEEELNPFLASSSSDEELDSDLSASTNQKNEAENMPVVSPVPVVQAVGGTHIVAAEVVAVETSTLEINNGAVNRSVSGNSLDIQLGMSDDNDSDFIVELGKLPDMRRRLSSVTSAPPPSSSSSITNSEKIEKSSNTTKESEDEVRMLGCHSSDQPSSVPSVVKLPQSHEWLIMTQPTIDMQKAGRVVPTPFPLKYQVVAVIDVKSFGKEKRGQSAPGPYDLNTTIRESSGSLHETPRSDLKHPVRQSGPPINTGLGDASTDRGIRMMLADSAETLLLTGHRGGAIQVWSLRSLPELRQVASYRAHGDGVVSAALFPSSRMAASCDLEGALHVWDTETATSLDIWRNGCSSALSKTKSNIATGGGGFGGFGGNAFNNKASNNGMASSYLCHSPNSIGPYVAIAEMQQHFDLSIRPVSWTQKNKKNKQSSYYPNATNDLQFGDGNYKYGDEEESSGEGMKASCNGFVDDVDWFQECDQSVTQSAAHWVKSPAWRSQHELLAATPTELHHFDLRCKYQRVKSQNVISRAQLLARAEWALSSNNLQVDMERDELFKGLGLRCLAGGRGDSMSDPYVYAGAGNGRAWCLDRRNGKVLFEWQAHSSEQQGAFASFGNNANSSIGGVGGGGVGGGSGVGGSSTTGSGSGANGGGSSAGVGSGGGGGPFGGDIRNAVLAISPGSARHSVVTVSHDQTAAIWDLSGNSPRRLSLLKGLPTVLTAGVMGAHLHSEAIQIREFVTAPSSDQNMLHQDGITSPTRHHSSMGSWPRTAPHQQMIFAAAGHKVTVSPLPTAHGVTETASPTSFIDRSGHKLHRHNLTVKASVVLPLWRMLLLGGSDDKIRICL